MAVVTQRHAAIYVRISADREGRELGVERQEQDCRKLAEALGLAVVEVFSDNDLSASRRSKKPRPGYQRMLAAARAGQITAVIAASSSRLTRQPRELEDWIDLAETGAVTVVFVAGRVDLMTPRGQRHARDDAARDSEYADEISYLAKRERQQRREQGRWHGGFRPFGFDRDGVTARPVEQKLIRLGCDAVLGGRSLAGVARDWAQVTPPPTWRAPFVVRWSTSTVRDVLVNPRIAGMLPNETPARDWEPIVDEATWRGVVAVLSDPARRRHRGTTRLLTSIATCGRCGAPVNGGVNAQGGPTYRCSAVRHLDRKAADVDNLVRDVVLGFLAREQLPVKATAQGTGQLAARAAGIRARLVELEASAGDPDGPSPRMLAAAERKLTAELEQVEADMAATVGTTTLVGLPSDADELRAAWEDDWDGERRRSVLKAVIEVSGLRIVIDPPGRGSHIFRPETVRIDWAEPRPSAAVRARP